MSTSKPHTARPVREQVRTAALLDTRFAAPSLWVSELLMPEPWKGWRAIIQASDGRVFEAPFRISAGRVRFEARHRELQTAAPLRARAVTEIREASGVIMFMPGGDHTITPGAGEGSAEVTVRIDELTPQVLNASLKAINERLAPQRVFIDKEHEGKEATAWPESFFWSQTPMPGVYVRAEYSAFGRDLVEGKVIRGFSPSFYTDADLPKRIAAKQHVTIAAGKRGSPQNPARVTGLASPDIGTLTNNPAFKRMLPLWAKDHSKT